MNESPNTETNQPPPAHGFQHCCCCWCHLLRGVCTAGAASYPISLARRQAHCPPSATIRDMGKPSQLRWFQFSLAGLLILATILCMVSAATRLLGGTVLTVAAIVTLFRMTH